MQEERTVDLDEVVALRPDDDIGGVERMAKRGGIANAIEAWNVAAAGRTGECRCAAPLTDPVERQAVREGRLMGLTSQQRQDVEDIIKTMECPAHFRCYASEFRDMCAVTPIGGGRLIECSDAQCANGDEGTCPFRFSPGVGRFCRCPLRRYAAIQLNR